MTSKVLLSAAWTAKMSTKLSLVSKFSLSPRGGQITTQREPIPVHAAGITAASPNALQANVILYLSASSNPSYSVPFHMQLWTWVF